MWRYFVSVYLVLLNSFVLVPQIIHNIRSAEPPSFNKYFLILFSSLKYLIFFYMRGCPTNILQIRYFYFVPFVGFFIIIVSLLILHHQDNYGPRGFLPKIFKKDVYDYWIEMTEFSKNQNKELEKIGIKSEFEKDEFLCCICLTSLLLEDNNNPKDEQEKQLKSKILNRILKTKGQRYLMQTPCGHVFHTDCLMRWMDIKMECPHCRESLPQIV